MTTLRVALLSAIVVAPAATAFAAGQTNVQRRCADAAFSVSLPDADAQAVCQAATPYVAACLETGYDLGLSGRPLVAACHSASEGITPCLEAAWLAGLRGHEIVAACPNVNAARGPEGAYGSYLNLPAAVQTTALGRCDGHIDIATDSLGRLTINFSEATDCHTFELWSANGVRRFTPEIAIGAGPMRRTGSWELPDRVARAASAGLKIVLRDAEETIQDTVFVGFVQHPAAP